MSSPNTTVDRPSTSKRSHESFAEGSNAQTNLNKRQQLAANEAGPSSGLTTTPNRPTLSLTLAPELHAKVVTFTRNNRGKSLDQILEQVRRDAFHRVQLSQKTNLSLLKIRQEKRLSELRKHMNDTIGEIKRLTEETMDDIDRVSRDSYAQMENDLKESVFFSALMEGGAVVQEEAKARSQDPTITPEESMSGSFDIALTRGDKSNHNHENASTRPEPIESGSIGIGATAQSPRAEVMEASKARSMPPRRAPKLAEMQRNSGI